MKLKTAIFVCLLLAPAFFCGCFGSSKGGLCKVGRLADTAQVYSDPLTGLVMVRVPVSLSGVCDGLNISLAHAPKSLFNEVMGNSGVDRCSSRRKVDNEPCVGVSVCQVNEFFAKLNGKCIKGHYRLPTSCEVDCLLESLSPQRLHFDLFQFQFLGMAEIIKDSSSASGGEYNLYGYDCFSGYNENASGDNRFYHRLASYIDLIKNPNQIISSPFRVVFEVF